MIAPKSTIATCSLVKSCVDDSAVELSTVCEFVVSVLTSSLQVDPASVENQIQQLGVALKNGGGGAQE